MTKAKTTYQCTNCSNTSFKWLGCCPMCNEWNSLIERKPFAIRHTTKKLAQEKFEVAPLQTFKTISTYKKARMQCGINEWDRVVGGGILPGSFLILTGDPGIGKSTLLLQAAHNIATHKKVIYFSSEESLEQVKNRATRLNCLDTSLFLSDHASLESILATAKDQQPDLLIIDSIQNCYLSGSQSIPGTIGQLREVAFHLMRLAKEQNIAVLVTGHITKEGYMAGPKILEHIVDGVFYLQGEDRWHMRILRSVKNRFGTINETGFFSMEEDGLHEVTNINEQLLSDTSFAPGACLITSLEGSRPILLELQALCVVSKFGIPQRVITGIDPKRVVLIAAILEKYLKIRFSAQDIFFKISNNFKIKESASDLGIALALLSSYFQKPLQTKSIAIGEISLTGQIKPINFINPRIREAEKFGMKTIYVARRQQLQTSLHTKTFHNVFELLSLFPEE